MASAALCQRSGSTGHIIYAPALVGDPGGLEHWAAITKTTMWRVTMEALANLGEIIGGLSVFISLIFLAIQIRSSNELARADSQRQARHAWQENLFYMSENSRDVREFVHCYEGMQPDAQMRAAHALIGMGNHLDLLLKLEKKGLETADNVRFMTDAFVGLVSTRGGHKFWCDMASIDMFGDNLLNEVNAKLKGMEIPNAHLTDVLPWIRPDEEWVS